MRTPAMRRLATEFRQVSHQLERARASHTSDPIARARYLELAPQVRGLRRTWQDAAKADLYRGILVWAGFTATVRATRSGYVVRAF